MFDPYIITAGLPTGSLTAVLGEPQQETIDDGPTVAVPFQPIASVTFYDTEERPVKTVSTTHLAGTHEQTETTYTLDSQPKTVRHTLKYNDYTYNDNYQYSYDRVGRLAGVKASLPWANLIDMNIGADAYNSIGQLVSSGSGSSATTYSYDIRGAISGLSNSAVKQSITRNANGTISKKIDNGIAHTFEYDNAGRLLSETCDNSDNHTGIFSSTYTYDRNSNITSLTRTGYPGGMSYPAYPVDDLKMTYDGNRLVKVADHADEVIVEKSFDFYDGSNSAAEYAYDDNGNVIRDSNRRLTGITYNALNQPSHIEVGNDAASEAIMDYIYDGAGKKLGTRSRISYFSDRPLTTYAIQEPCRAEDHDYIGNYEFKNGRVHRVNTPYGYITMGGFFTYLRDYQGNNRNHASYYAYGLPVQGAEVKDPDPYLYGGKEFYSLRGVNLYDFNARTYAPDIARFMQPDPKADDYNWLSPYAYCGGDPINKIDPNGLAWHLIEEDEKEARFEWVDPQKSYDQEGNLLPDHYEQAISFSASGSKGSYDSSKMYNMGTSTATVYKADGTTEDFDACTKPADPSKYATVPKGRYEAKVGMHKNSYPALRMGDVGTTNFNNNSIELGEPNPSSPARTTAIGINIHRAGENNLTGIGGSGAVVSKGCFLIDRNRWDEFINIFNTPEQKNNTIGISRC